jgi:hypothetical protein
MGRQILAGDQAGELEEHSGPSRSGDRHDGCRGVGRGGCGRPAAYLRWLPRCTGRPADWLPRRTCPGTPDKRRDPGEESCDRIGHGDRLHIRHCAAVPDGHSAFGLRAVSGPTVAVA